MCAKYIQSLTYMDKLLKEIIKLYMLVATKFILFLIFLWGHGTDPLDKSMQTMLSASCIKWLLQMYPGPTEILIHP